MRRFIAVTVVCVGLGLPALADGRWRQVENKANCVVWNDAPRQNESVTWTGDCVNGKAAGSGRQVWRFLQNGVWRESRYTGEMRGGKAHGLGVYVWPGGERYEGGWGNGKWHGFGVYVSADGVRYEGEFRGGKVRNGPSE